MISDEQVDTSVKLDQANNTAAILVLNVMWVGH